MPLIDLQTNLKSLKYGADRLGGGDSGLPYIKKDINAAKTGLKFDDGLVRGGTVNAAVAGAVDTARIAKFLKDPPKGPLFLVKQVGLQLSNPRLEVKDKTLDSATAGLLQPTRIYNLGLNTLAQVPVNAFGIHFNRHGLLPVQDENTKYESVVRNNAGLNNDNIDTANKFNRLIRLTSKFKLGNNTTNNTENIINRYVGGPESVYGIGLTTIKRTTYTGYSARIDNAKNTSTQYAGFSRVAEPGVPINYSKALGKKDDFRSIFNYNAEIQYIYSDPVEVKKGIDNNAIEYGNLKTYSDIIKQTKTEISQSTGAGLSTSGSFITVDLTKHGLNRDATDYNYISGSRLTIFNRNEDNVYPKITFEIIKPFGRSEVVSLSAYINGFRDGFNSTWSDVNYAGRAESFYIYTKFKREVSFSLQIPCFDRTQLKTNHQILNTLASVTAGSYEGVLLGGVLIRLTVPNYIVGEYATLNSISYDMPDGATWDIDEKLSMYLNAQFNFTIIHQNLPQLGSKLIAPNV